MATFVPLGEKACVRFSDVAGLDDAKRDISLRMILPLQYPDKASALRVRQGGGLLLQGRPGVGKTLLARAVAGELDCPFYHVRPSDIMASAVGGAEKNVQRLFQTVRANHRAVLFLDEVESMVPKRRGNGSTIMARVISQFLSEVDGLTAGSNENILLLIGATNESDLIDPAMCRPGRFDTIIDVGPPDAAAREQILRLSLKDRSLSDDFHIQHLVQATGGKTGAEIRHLVEQAADIAFLRSIKEGEAAPPVIMMADFESNQGASQTGGASASSIVGRQFSRPVLTNDLA